MKEIIQQLKQLQQGAVNPRPEWVVKNRTQLLSQIRNTLPAKSARQTTPKLLESVWSFLSYFIPRSIVYNIIRPAAALVVALAIVTGSSIGAVDAAYDALPGDPVAYPLKRNIEKIRVGVASLMGDNNGEAKLHMEFAKRRAVEVKKIIAISKVDPQKINQVAVAVADLKNEVATVNEKLAGQGTDTLAAKVVKDLKQDTEQLKTALQDVKNNLNVSSTPENQLISKEVSETRDLVKDVSVKAMEVIMSKHLDGQISKEEMRQVIDRTLQSAASEVGEVQQNVDGAKIAVDAAKTEVTGLTDDAGKQAAGSIVSSTAEAAAQLNVVVEETAVAAHQTQAASAEVDKKTNEVKELLSTGDLTKVLDKLKEVNQVTKDAEKISDSAVEKAQTILPMVGVIKDNSLPAVIIPSGGLSASTSAAITASATKATSTLLVVTTTLKR